MRVFEPQSLNVITTNRCTAACSHCCMNSGPERTEKLSSADLMSILGELLREVRGIKVVVFAGGEPLLLGEALLDGIRHCRAHGVVSRVVTNAYWASCPEEASRVVAELRAAGLDELNISTDDQHLPYVSLQRVRWAYEAALESDFMSVAIAHCSGPMSVLTPERIDAEFGGGEMDRRFGPDGVAIEQSWTAGETKVLLSNAHLQRIGRGTETLTDAELPKGVDDLADQGGCPWAVRSAAISPNGHLWSCCGFELEDNPLLDYGDLRERPVGETLDAVDNDLITNLIAILGPPKIKAMLEEHWPEETRFEGTYHTYCEVCSDLVNIPENRAALLAHQGAFIDIVVSVREQLRELWSDGNGVVDLPVDLVVSPRTEENLRAHAAATE